MELAQATPAQPEVVEGELVEEEPSGPLTLTKRVKQEIQLHLGPNEDEEWPGSTIGACAQYAGIKPEKLEAVIEEATGNPTHPDYKFVLKVLDAMARREDYLQKEMYRIARDKKETTPFREALKAQHRDWKEKPKTVNVNESVTIVHKLQQAQSLRSNKALPTGD